ncbi:MAG TPA: kelch repeat-containing protein, partial [bacterium]
MKRKLIITAWFVLLIFSSIFAQERAPAWEALANMPTPRFGHSAVIYQGKIWVIAGKSQVNNTLNTVDCFDLEKKEWESCPAKLIHSRFDAAAVVYQNKIFVIGGRNDRQILNSVEYYDSDAGQWKEFAPLGYPRWGASAVVYKDILFVINGITNKSIIPTPVDSIEFWDEAADTWQTSKDWQLIQARGFAQSVVIDSFVYTLGGSWFD